jgi:cytochrome P450
MLDDGELHSGVRKAAVAGFHADRVREHIEIAEGVARRTIGSWPRGTAVALHDSLRAFTLEVVLRTLFADGSSAHEDRLLTLRDRMLEMLSIVRKLAYMEPATRRAWGYASWQRFLRRRGEVRELLVGMIEEHLGGVRDAGDVLVELVAARRRSGAPCSPNGLCDDVMSLLVAGHETTASQLAWAFQLLAHNPAVRERLTAEVDRGEDGEYLTATVQEVLRHRPVFPFLIPRVVNKPYEIGGWTCPRGSLLLGCAYLLHHDPLLYPEPQAFRPERFIEAPPNPRTWLPWGGGRKRCPGLHLAVLEIETMLRMVLSRVSVHPAAKRMERPAWRTVILTPHAGSRVILEDRDWSPAAARARGSCSRRSCGARSPCRAPRRGGG